MGERDSTSWASVVLTCERKPPSTNNVVGKGRDDFGAELERQYETAGRPRLEGLLYGVVCWFVRDYRPDNEPDADNISKGVWDMLSARKSNDPAERLRLGAFCDDKQVRLRVASIFDLASKEQGAPLLEQLNLTGVPPDVVQQLGNMVSGNNTSRHLTYIQFGPLHGRMYKLTFSEGSP